jgi:hypothetical protein
LGGQECAHSTEVKNRKLGSRFLGEQSDSLFGFRRASRTRRKHVSATATFPGDYAVKCFVRLISSFSQPKDILSAYLRRPLPGTPFRRTIEGIAKGLSGRGLGGIPRSELLTRAARLLQWLDGKESDGKNPYEVLGLSYSATSAQIHHRYRTLSKRVHPDRHPPSRQDYWRVRQQEVNEAYRMLSDPKSRGQYLARVEERAKLLRRLWQMERARRR